MPRRASLPEGKSLFFRRTADEVEADDVEVAPKPVEAPDTGPRPVEQPRPMPPTPRSDRTAETGATRQSAIFLEERHLDWLEDKCREARQRGGRAIRKALIIRALLDVAMESPVDLTSLGKEEDLVERVRRGLRGG
jgi:hypothetical protein